MCNAAGPVGCVGGVPAALDFQGDSLNQQSAGTVALRYGDDRMIMESDPDTRHRPPKHIASLPIARRGARLGCARCKDQARSTRT